MSALVVGPPGFLGMHICSDCKPKLRIEDDTVWCPCGAQIVWAEGHAPVHNEHCTHVPKWCERCGVRGAREGVAMCGPCNTVAFQALGMSDAPMWQRYRRRSGGAGSANPRYGGDPNAAPWSHR